MLLVFIYMGVTGFILGYGALSFLTQRDLFFIPNKGPVLKNSDKGGRYYIHHRLSYLLAGVVCASIYAQIFSLFAPVGLTANIILVVICLFIIWYYRGQIIDRLMARAGFAGLRSVKGTLPDGYLLSRKIWLLYVLLILGMAYGTSHGIMHYDTGLYHAQSIRFAEEYGVIKGLANLHSRLGYDSSVYPLSALYSFAFTGGNSIHACAGYIALLLAFACLDIKHILRRGRPVLSDFFRFAGLYYLFNIYKEMVSPASDYFVNCFLFCILILWTDRDIHRERHFMPYALMCAGLSYAVTIKLSAAPLLLLSIKPIVQIVRDTRLRNRRGVVPFRGRKSTSYTGRGVLTILSCALICFLTVVPWFVRNVFISGWLLYPSTAADIFNVEWKLPHDLAEGDAAGIRAYARGTAVAEPGESETGITEWFKPWFFSQSLMSRVLIVADICAVFGYIAYLFSYIGVVYCKYKKRQERKNRPQKKALAPVLKISSYSLLKNSDFIFLEGMLLLSFVFWLLEAPMIRYGFFMVWAPPMIIGGRVFLLLLNRLPDKKAKQLTEGFALILTAFLLYKGVRLVVTDVTLMHPQYLATQQDYEKFTVIPYELDGETLYYPAEGDRTGYYGFPGSPYELKDVRLMGESLKDGLAPKTDSQ